MTNRQARKARREQRRAARQARIAARQTKRQERRAKRQDARADRKSTRQEGRQKRKQARVSRKAAEKLQKEYGDMTPEEIQAINEIEPYKAGMAKELQEQGVELRDEEDPIEVATRYAQVNGDVSPELEGAIEEAYVYEDEDFDDCLDEEDRKQRRRGAFGKIGGFIGEILPTAARYFGGGKKDSSSNVGAAVQGYKGGARKEGLQQIFSNPLTIVALLVVGYLIVKKN